MTDSKHTPGPWRWNDSDELEAADGAIVVETDSACYPPYGADRDLIAAAPELLAALVEHLAWYDGKTSVDETKLIADTRAAIARARGDK